MDAIESAESAVSVQTLQAPLRGSFDLRRFSSDAVLVIGAALVANVFSYAFHFILSRRLGPDHYGTLATMIAISGMLGVLGSAVGTVAMQETARMWASHLDRRIAPFVRRTGLSVLALAGLVAAAIALLSLPLQTYLHVADPLLWLLLAVYVGAAIFSGFARGAAQGAHRFGIFATSLVSEGVAKVVFAVAFVSLGFGVGGALGGLICGVVIGVGIVFAPMVFGGAHDASHLGERVRLQGEAAKVLTVTATTSALLFVDMLFAKHHFSGVVTGYFSAAGTVARTIPYGVGLVALVLMPKAAAAQHASRDSLRRILIMAGAIALALTALSLAFIMALPREIIAVTYGAKYLAAVPILRVYALDEALFSIFAVAVSYLVAIARYQVFAYLLAAAVVESLCMALFGGTPLHLLRIAITVNALLVPVVWALAWRSLAAAPQAATPVRAEGAASIP
ncbi:MAG: hypothetical protein DLM53_10725 [Candidatus Eremiobacter antarcticus]|nr:hypothetical protein [Candidatus Eremiobacteraeota bacterium]PZR60822.1 MAG: hypothetical protein DLM53_10725 [Candidatus Eremiobacter sp. RRmetagenome_bin22]